MLSVRVDDVGAWGFQTATASILHNPDSRLQDFSQGWIACLPWQQAHHLLVTKRFVFVTV